MAIPPTVSSDPLISTGSDRVVLRGSHNAAPGEDFLLVCRNVPNFSGVPTDPDDMIYCLGFNPKPLRGAAELGDNPGKPSFYMQFERNFIEGELTKSDRTAIGAACYEWHITTIGEDGKERRPIMLTAPRKGATGPGKGAFGYITTDTFAFTSWAGVNMLNWSLPDHTIQIKEGTRFQFSKNNVTVAQQHNAAENAFLDLWKINSRDEQNGTQPTSIEAASKPNFNGQKSLLSLLDTDPTTGASLVYSFVFKPVPGTYFVRNMNVDATVLIDQITNRNATGAFIQNLAAGGTVARGMNAANKPWQDGVDAASGEYRLVPGDFFTQAPALAGVRSTRQIKFGGSAKLSSFTVAALPNPGAEGAGALVFVSDAKGGACIACSNGSSWRRVDLGPAVT
jgi:hypothetical protein